MHFGPIKFGIITSLQHRTLTLYLYRIGTSLESNGLVTDLALW